jgi:hypothetical protein
MELFPPPIVSLAIPASQGLPPLPKPLDLDRPTHWLGDDGYNVFIEVCGGLTAVAVRQGPLKKNPPVRQECKGFSPASRLRLFKLTNRLDFAVAGRCSFVTATWRDEVGCPTYREVTRARSLFQRNVEGLAGKKLAALWRVEWKQRKSGGLRGQLMPHVHLIYFDIPYVPLLDVSRAWARAIGWNGRVSLRIEEIGNLRKCLNYVSKYIAKLPEIGNLDIASYLDQTGKGRSWGTLRKNKLPLSEAVVVRVAPGPLVEAIRSLATRAYGKTPQDKDKGFCVFGSIAEEVRQLIAEFILTEPEGSVH